MGSGQPLRVLGELLRQHLDGNFTAEVGVLGAVHFPHSALADLLDDFVVGKCFANHGIGTRSLNSSNQLRAMLICLVMVSDLTR